MKLTKEYIRDVKFERSKKGYSTDQVDDFLDLVSTEHDELREQIEKSKSELEKYRNMEATLTNVLVSAENNAKKVEEEAHVRAAAIVSNAEESAKKLRASIEAEEYLYREKYAKEREEIIKQIERLRGFFALYKNAVLEDIERFKQKFTEEQSSDKVWEEKPAEINEQAAKESEQTQQPGDETGEKFDLSDILKNLPESDSELKAMIDELI